MRKIVLIATAGLFILIMSYLTYGTIMKSEERKAMEKKISVFPSFSLTTLQGNEFNSGEIKEGPVLVILFHPECAHCQYEISGIMESRIPASVSKILMVSGANRNDILQFSRQNKLSLLKNALILVDSSYIFGDIFGNNVVPSNYIYGKDLNLIKAFHGECRIETLQKYISE